MAFVTTYRKPAGGGSGPTSDLLWQNDREEETDPFSSGYSIPLTHTPIDADSLIVYSQNNPLDTDDFNYDSGTNSVIILFSGDPATDTSNGIWVFRVQYPYEV